MANYAPVTSWDTINRGKELHSKFIGIRKWKLHLIMESLAVILQFALLLFFVSFTLYLWDLDAVSANIMLAVTSVGLAFYISTTVAAAIWNDCPFQTPLSVLLPKIWPWVKKHTALTHLWFEHWLRRTATPLLPLIILGPLAHDPPTGFSNPARRHDPLFPSPVPNRLAASAGFCLLENFTDFATTSTVVAAFTEIQWPSHHDSSIATLVHLRDMYMECFQSPEPDRLTAIQFAAAYYVLYHTQFIWGTSNGLSAEVMKPLTDLPSDLFRGPHSHIWDEEGMFEYILGTGDRSEPATSARSLSYISPYWVLGDSSSTTRDRLSCLGRLNEVIGFWKNPRS